MTLVPNQDKRRMFGETFHVMLSKGVVNAIRKVKAATDEEACGFLIGQQRETGVYVENIRPATNIYRAKESFAISHQEFIDVQRSCDAEERIVGIYHTHPGEARLSYQDRESIALSPFFWLIVGNVSEGQDEWRCFIRNSGRVKELRMSIAAGNRET